MVGQAYSYQAQASGTGPITWSRLSGPAWISVDSSTGLVSGTPAAAGSYPVSIRASNSAGSDTQSYTVVVLSGEGTKVSKNADFSTDDSGATFYHGDTLHVMFFSAFLDSSQIVANEAQFEGFSAAFTNNSDGTYTVAIDLNSAVTGLSSGDTAMELEFMGLLEDGAENAMERALFITVDPNAPPAPPVAAFSGTPTSGAAPLTVNFADASTNATSWSWTFGDGGTSTAQDASYAYTTPGTYTVALTVSGPAGSDTLTKAGYITVSAPAPPVAAFSGTPTSGVAPLTVHFADASTNATSWSWTFGDGGTSIAQNPSYAYTTPGTYTVALTVSGPGGSDSVTKAGYITASAPPPPIAAFSGTPTSGAAPLTVNFTDASTNATSWSWTFGDGGTSIAQNPSYTYTTPGTYTVALTVSGPGGSDTLTKAGYVTISAPAEPPDVVTIIEVSCEPGAELVVEATSTDETATLTVVGFGVMENLGEGEYEFVTSVSDCPSTVTVTSDSGGEDTATIVTGE